MFAHLLNNAALYFFDYHSISLSKQCFAKASDVSAIYEKRKQLFSEWKMSADLQQPMNFIHFSFVCRQSDISPWLRSCGLPSMIFNWETFPLWQRNHSVPSRWRNPSAQVSEAFKQSKVKFTFCDCLLNINSMRCCLRIWHEQSNLGGIIIELAFLPLFVHPERGKTLVQRKPTMYPAWKSKFDAHIYEGRVIQVVLMKTAEESLSEATVGVSVIAERCKKGNGLAEFWVDLQPSGKVMMSVQFFVEDSELGRCMQAYIHSKV